MAVVLENEWIRAEFKELGAEQTSFKLKKDDTEYLWQADPQVWARHAPVLFPIVGKLKDNMYETEEMHYKMDQHGFARDKVFEVVGQGDDSVTFRLTDDEQTLKIYPYRFELLITYTLMEKTVKTTYVVRSTDVHVIYFSIGAHPGFRCPIEEGETFSDYEVYFDNDEIGNVRQLNYDGLVSNHKEKLEFSDDQTIPMTEKLFKNGCWIFENLISETVILRSRKSGRSVTMHFPDFEYFLLWTVAKDPRFLCMEPWQGVADFEKTTTVMGAKKGIQYLLPGDKFECSFTMTIG